MRTITSIARPQAPCRASAPRRQPTNSAAPTRHLRAAARSSVRVRSVVSDVGKYLSEAASQIFRPQGDSDVPWEQSGQGFTGRIAHHEEAARLRALKEAVDQAVRDMETSMDEAPLDGPASVEEPGVGQYVLSSIQRVFSSNFKGEESEPKAWISTGYASSGRHRSQRALRAEYERLQRFQRVVHSVAERAKPGKAE